MNREYLPLAVMLLLIAFFLLLPPKWDPAFRLGQWLRKRRKK